MSHRPQILISNDDSIQAAGIEALARVAANFGDVTVVAPNAGQSGMGHAISLGKPLRLYPAPHFGGGIKAYSCNGTPADCVKLATGVLLHRNPDLVLSGINHGANSSASAIYSGTLAAAREAAIQGVAAVGFSLLNHAHSADMTAAARVAEVIIAAVLENKLAAGQLLSVNIPDIPYEDMKGFRITRQASGRWVEEFDERIDPYGQPYYWLTGKFLLQDDSEETDEHALRNGYVSISPMMHDLTEHSRISEYSRWQLSL